ncbi:MAG: gamma-glutamyl-gamma-aminobutyrate hydrolase family protein [Candidatus Nitrosopolaris sp.]
MTVNKNKVQTTLVVDNLSPFTPDIVTCLGKLGAKCVRKSFFNVTINSNDSNSYSGYKSCDNGHINNNSKCLGGANYDNENDYNRRDLIDNNNNINNNNFSYDKVILSGRRMNNREINIVNSSIIRQCFENNIPLLGICYGAEILALTLGGTLRKMARPVQDTISITVSKSNSLISAAKKTLLVYESHRYCVAKLPEGFESLASSLQCEHEVFSHKEKKMFGTQFHPEKSGVDGLNILSKFLSI